jgi:hypothetical protein
MVRVPRVWVGPAQTGQRPASEQECVGSGRPDQPLIDPEIQTELHRACAAQCIDPT